MRRSSTHRRVEDLIRQGVGVREASWDMAPAGDASAREQLAEELAGWVREAMATMRRPYGIDHVALALACRDAAGRILSTSSLGVIRPGCFYGAEGIGRIAGFLDDVESVRSPGPVNVTGALLSLGDLAFQLDIAHAA